MVRFRSFAAYVRTEKAACCVRTYAAKRLSLIHILQALYDRSDGFYRRQLILTTKDKPLSRVDDPDIAEKMAAEVEGLSLIHI